MGPRERAGKKGTWRTHSGDSRRQVLTSGNAGRPAQKTCRRTPPLPPSLTPVSRCGPTCKCPNNSCQCNRSMNLNEELMILENADVVPYALFLVLGYAFGNPRDIADLLS